MRRRTTSQRGTGMIRLISGILFCSYAILVSFGGFFAPEIKNPLASVLVHVCLFGLPGAALISSGRKARSGHRTAKPGRHICKKSNAAKGSNVRTGQTGIPGRQEVHVGMSLKEVIRLLGEPSQSMSGADVLKMYGQVSGSSRAISSVCQSGYFFWSRPEGEYQLVVKDGKVVEVYGSPT